MPTLACVMVSIMFARHLRRENQQHQKNDLIQQENRLLKIAQMNGELLNLRLFQPAQDNLTPAAHFAERLFLLQVMDQIARAYDCLHESENISKSLASQVKQQVTFFLQDAAVKAFWQQNHSTYPESFQQWVHQLVPQEATGQRQDTPPQPSILH